MEDLFAVGLARDGWAVASHLIAMDTMAFGIVGGVVWGTQVFIGRQRPSAYYCETDPSYVAEFGTCGRYGATRSFLSGHFASAVAAASLTCLYHDRFQIYRRRRGGPGACGTTIALAVLTGISRSTGDGHWMTDVLGGGALGFLAGWVMPRAVLFGFDGSGVRRSAARTLVAARVQPFFERSAAGIETRGAF
ncbi:MAG: phosphatase PAP2 family protein [Polyangiaceae bacterium]|nr:phosphatase PAP2 family protein [Polyangiaceae bacterium]